MTVYTEQELTQIGYSATFCYSLVVNLPLLLFIFIYYNCQYLISFVTIKETERGKQQFKY